MKRLISLTLVLALVIALIPGTFAVTNEERREVIAENEVPVDYLAAMTILKEGVMVNITAYIQLDALFIIKSSPL